MATKLTNNTGLPQSIFDAIKNDSFKRLGDYSITQLCEAPQIVHLRRTNNIEEDVTDKVFALLDSAVSSILEKANITDVRKRAFMLVIDTFKTKAIPNTLTFDQYNKVANYLTETMRLFFPELESKFIFDLHLDMEVNGKSIYGKIDMYDKETQRLKVYELCSVYKFIFPESRKRWYTNMNVLAYMCEMNDLPVKGIDAVMIFRDYSESRKASSVDYPAKQIMEVEIPLHPMEARQSFITSKVTAHIQAEKGNVPECTGADMWTKAPSWAIMPKPGAKRALKIFPSENEALTYKAENMHSYIGMFIEHRPGENTRCNDYCPVRDNCIQRKKTT